MIRTIFRTALLAGVVTTMGAGSAFAGNIALTGHDSDFHCFGFLPQASCTQVAAMLSFARAGSANPTLPVLSFDQGIGSSALVATLTGLGVTFTNVADPLNVNAALFDPTVYSAFIVASDESCGGCDNDINMINALTAQSAAIASFFNAGGGIVGLAGAGNADTYYGFLPQSASGFGDPPSTGFVQTTCGASLGIPAVNGDPTHNFFSEPGTGGVSALYCAVERLTDATTGTVETLALQGGRIVDDVIVTDDGVPAVPEPATLTLLGVGLVGSGLRRLRRKK